MALFATMGVAGAGAAWAAGDPTFYFDPVENKVLMPGEGRVELSPPSTGGHESGQADGTYVYAVSKKPLTDAGWSGGGAPGGLKVDLSQSPSCKPKAGVAGVYLCDVKEHSFPSPEVSAASTVANDTRAYYSLVYVPRGSSIDAGVKEAQTAGSKPIGPRRAHATITARTQAQVAGNTLALSTPTVPAGKTVKHSVKLHAVDAATLTVSMTPAPGQRHWNEDELKTGIVSANAPGAECSHTIGWMGYTSGVTCDIAKPGDYTLTYELKADAKAPSWKLRTTAVYEVYDYGTGNPEKSSDWAITGQTRPADRHRLVGRDADGNLWDHRGTGKAPGLFGPVDPVLQTIDWNQYTQLTRLGPVTTQSTGPGAVGRDKSGMLWFHPVSGDGAVYKNRVKVGPGWNIYNSLAGASDLTGDKKADLVARDTAGTLWLYPGTGNASAAFGGRVKVGGGWNIYNSLVGAGDVTGDKKADLLARDTSGKLWLYPGTGAAAKPFGNRIQVGPGWQAYNSLVAPGDLNSDGKADLVARDTAGALWYYQGTGSTTQPYAARVKVGTGWQRYNLLF
ncbi:FG-GAP repeat domain-containing protein [Streptomyces sp. NPDC048603]|uniref:FG-GAP repeat domain-containing protein n=1 Tax=Streptomyces sp. NPDC048603 TaxID=3365577 RepID=UPI00371FC8F7